MDTGQVGIVPTDCMLDIEVGTEWVSGTVLLGIDSGMGTVAVLGTVAEMEAVDTERVPVFVSGLTLHSCKRFR